MLPNSWDYFLVIYVVFFFFGFTIFSLFKDAIFSDYNIDFFCISLMSSRKLDDKYVVVVVDFCVLNQQITHIQKGWVIFSSCLWIVKKKRGFWIQVIHKKQPFKPLWARREKCEMNWIETYQKPDQNLQCQKKNKTKKRILGACVCVCVCFYPPERIKSCKEGRKFITSFNLLFSM